MPTLIRLDVTVHASGARRWYPTNLVPFVFGFEAQSALRREVVRACVARFLDEHPMVPILAISVDEYFATSDGSTTEGRGGSTQPTPCYGVPRDSTVGA